MPNSHSSVLYYLGYLTPKTVAVRKTLFSISAEFRSCKLCKYICVDLISVFKFL